MMSWLDRNMSECFKVFLKCFMWNYMCIRWLMNWSDSAKNARCYNKIYIIYNTLFIIHPVMRWCISYVSGSFVKQTINCRLYCCLAILLGVNELRCDTVFTGICRNDVASVTIIERYRNLVGLRSQMNRWPVTCSSSYALKCRSKLLDGVSGLYMDLAGRKGAVLASAGFWRNHAAMVTFCSEYNYFEYNICMGCDLV
jgi:hypothetical protein